MRGVVLALCLLIGACSAPPNQNFNEARTPVWRVTGLAEPESVALGADGRTLYVANVSGQADAHDGDGFISRVTTGGRLMDLKWVTGLDAPKGAMVADEKLYVSDIDKLVEIDIPAGRIVARYPAPGARFLNDVAVAPDGTVLVSDSGTGRIYALEGRAMRVWSAAPELKGANGLLAEPGRLLVVTLEGRLLSIDYPSRAAKVLASGLGQADGISTADGDNYLVSDFPGRLLRVTPDGHSKAVFDTSRQGVQINDFIRTGDLLILPNWTPGSLTAYRMLPAILTDDRGARLPPQLQRLLL